MGKFAQNKELRTKIAKFIQEKYNAFYPEEPDKQITDKDIENLINDETKVRLHEKSARLIDEKHERTEEFNKLEKEMGYKGGVRKQILRIVANEYDLSGTQEALEFNKKLILLAHDNKKSQVYLNKCVTDLLSADAKDFLPEPDLDKMIDKFEKNMVFYEKAFLINDFVNSEDGNLISKDVEKIVNHQKSIIQVGGYVRSTVEIMSNPLFLCVPEKIMKDPMFMGITIDLGAELNKPEYKDFQDEIHFDEVIEESKQPGKHQNEKERKTYVEQYIAGFVCTPFGANLLTIDRLSDDAKNSVELLKDEKDTKDFIVNKEFGLEKNGEVKVSSSNDVLDHVYAGKDKNEVKIVDRNPAEVKAYKEAIKKPFIYNFEDVKKEFHNEIVKLEAAKAKLDDTLGLFTRDSDEFKAMRKNLDNTIKDLKKFEKNIKSPKEYAEEHNMGPLGAHDALYEICESLFNKHNEIKERKNDVSAYLLKKNEDLVKLEAKGKTFNERTIERLKIAGELEKLYSTDMRTFNLPTKEVNEMFREHEANNNKEVSKELQENLKGDVSELNSEKNLDEENVKEAPVESKEAEKETNVSNETYPPIGK